MAVFSKAAGWLRRLLPLCAGLSVAVAESVTFHEHVAPVLFEHCAPCHRPGQAGPFPLLTFGDAKKHAQDLAEVTARRYMPPWLPAPAHGEFVGARRLTDAQIAVFANWFAAGAPEGDRAKSPPLPTWPSDWQLGPPDLIVRMPAAYTVPPDGRDVYRHFVLPANITNRRQVVAWEFRPHSRAAHHAFLRVDRSGEGRRRDALDPDPGFPGMDTPTGIESPGGHFLSWQPGAAPRRHAPGLGWVLEPGSDFVMQLHLQPLGKPEPLQAELGLYFSDQPPTNRPVKVSLINYAFEIPPGASNVVVTDEFVLPAEADLLAVLPHAHYLGRRLEGHALLPDGRDLPLLVIPEWDFNWQGDYTYREPVFLPAGTRLQMRFQFDNSANNPRNPFSPPRPAHFGLNTTDEMAELWLQLLPRTAPGAAAFERANLERTIRDSIGFNEQRLRINPNDAGALVNLGRALLARGRNEDARGRFQQAVAADPRSEEGHYYLGLLHRLAGRGKEAAGEFARVLELNPNHVRAHGNLGLMHYEMGRLEPAARHLAEAVRLDPQDALAHATLGAIRARQSRLQEAELLLRRAVELDPNDVEARQNLARLQERLAKP